MNESPPADASRTSLLWRFYRLISAFVVGESRGQARTLLAALLGLSIAVGVIQVLISYAARDFVTALTDRDEPGFYRNLWRYLGTFAIAIPIGAFYKYVADRLSLAWREWMTNHLLRRYFYNRVYYRLRSSKVVDNPDQRITEDVRLFTTNILGYLLIVINSLITLVGFIGVLWWISPQLVVALVGYAATGTATSILIGRRLVGLHFTQYQREADFRYGLVRVRDNAESIAFFRGEKREHHDLVSRFIEVIRNTLDIIVWNRNLAFFTNAYGYIALIVPPLIVGPLYMRGEIPFGAVTQAESAFAAVLLALSMIVAQFDGLSACAAGVRRLGELWDELDEFDAEDERDADASQIEVNESRRSLKMDDLTVQTPDGSRTLTSKLSFELAPGKGLLIMGESGSGKSSLLRTIAGLWQSGTGSIERPSLNRMIFLPQRPYMVQGTLRAQLAYPQAESAADEDAVKEAFEHVNLEEVLKRVDGDLTREVDWTNVLSIGEQQRVSFARLFLKKPVMAFLDEATSALDEPNEQLLYERLRELGISFVSVGHRSTLKPFHDHLLVLRMDGTWEIGEVDDEPPARKGKGR
jgi:putative ATP-binding cassette transporter